jgi:hypothetical protein
LGRSQRLCDGVIVCLLYTLSKKLDKKNKCLETKDSAARLVAIEVKDYKEMRRFFLTKSFKHNMETKISKLFHKIDDNIDFSSITQKQ